MHKSCDAKGRAHGPGGTRVWAVQESTPLGLSEKNLGFSSRVDHWLRLFWLEQLGHSQKAPQHGRFLMGTVNEHDDSSKELGVAHFSEKPLGRPVGCACWPSHTVWRPCAPNMID